MEEKIPNLVINSLEELIAVSNFNITFQVIKSKRVHTKEGWLNFVLSPEVVETIVDAVVDCLGGQKKYKSALKQSLTFTSYHWSYERLGIRLFEDSVKVSYFAGQDYVAELRNIRNYLKR